MAGTSARDRFPNGRGKPNGLILLHVVAGVRNDDPGAVREAAGKALEPALTEHLAPAALDHQDGTRKPRRKVGQFGELAENRREVRSAAPVHSPCEAIRPELQQMPIAV